MSEQKKEPKKYAFNWGMEVKPIYGPEDLREIDYVREIGNPGDFPFTRGAFPLMYRSRQPLNRVYSGFLSGEDTNARLRYLFDRGMSTMSIALDLPTQLGLDSDDPRAEDEVGRIGVAIDTLRDMEDVLHGIDLGKVSTNITINALAPILLAMYIAAAEKQGVGKNQISIVTQNDILKEYVVRGAWIFPPRPSLRTTVDVIEYCSREVPKASPVSVAAGHLRSSGANAAQEIAWGFEIAFAYLQEALNRGLDVDQVASFITFTFHNKLNFFEEAAKFRAARRIWAKTLRERFRAKNPKSMILRAFGGGGMEELTMEEPLNNVIRETLVALGAILGGVQGVGLCCYDEAYTIPTEQAQLISMRTFQILMEEAGMGDVSDPLGGSYYLEQLTGNLENAALKLMEEIEQTGGMVKAIEEGRVQRQCTRGAYERQRQIDSGEKVWVGANKYRSEGQEWDVAMHEYDPAIQARQVEKLRAVRRERDNGRVESCLKDLEAAAREGANVVPPTLDAVKAYATVGEMTGVLKGVFGEFKEPAVF